MKKVKKNNVPPNTKVNWNDESIRDKINKARKVKPVTMGLYKHFKEMYGNDKPNKSND